MNKTYRSLSLLAAMACLSAAHGQYTATILNPMGATLSRAFASYGGTQAGFAGGGSIVHAACWKNTSASVVDLNPAGWNPSFAYGASKNTQVGMGRGAATSYIFHALMWKGTSASVVDLHPAAYAVSCAYAADGGYQSGQVSTFDSQIHAAWWKGTAASVIDLNPVGATISRSYGIYGRYQVGMAEVGGISHAYQWTGSARSAIDLNGTLEGSVANAIYGGTIVGSGWGPATGGITHAMIWPVGSKAFVDLNPAGLTDSVLMGAGVGVQAGYGSGAATGFTYHAFAWKGTAASAVDLHKVLPSTYTRSFAYGVDPVTGQIVGEAVNSLGRSVAVVWTPL